MMEMETMHEFNGVPDLVNHPSHYNSGRIEVIEAIYDWGLDFDLGNAVKYIARAGKKSPDTFSTDLRKAIFYLNHKIEMIKMKEKEEKSN